MIFLSHNYLDKEFVGSFATDLGKIFGTENIFFDEWSIKPGENIIERMNKGLEESKFFFFFISKNSLASEMVKLEWTNVLKEKFKRKIQFIPIRCDDSDLPFILSTINYLDLFNNGYDIILRQMIEIIKSDISDRNYPTFKNLQAYVYSEGERLLRYYIEAKKFFEPSSYFLFVTNLSKDQIKVEMKSSNVYNYQFNSQVGTRILGTKETILNGIVISSFGGIKKGFLTEITVEVLSGDITDLILYHVKEENKFEAIPLEVISHSMR